MTMYVQSSGSWEQEAQRHFVPGPNMWTLKNLVADTFFIWCGENFSLFSIEHVNSQEPGDDANDNRRLKRKEKQQQRNQ